MCVMCRQMKPKKEMLRVVRTDEGFVVDTTGRANGRGAYICTDTVCMEKVKSMKIIRKLFGGKAAEGFSEDISEALSGMAKENGNS